MPCFPIPPRRLLGIPLGPSICLFLICVNLKANRSTKGNLGNLNWDFQPSPFILLPVKPPQEVTTPAVQRFISVSHPPDRISPGSDPIPQLPFDPYQSPGLHAGFTATFRTPSSSILLIAFSRPPRHHQCRQRLPGCLSVKPVAPKAGAGPPSRVGRPGQVRRPVDGGGARGA